MSAFPANLALALVAYMLPYSAQIFLRYELLEAPFIDIDQI